MTLSPIPALDAIALQAAHDAYAASTIDVPYHICETCGGSGNQGGSDCRDCHGVGNIVDLPDNFDPLASAIAAFLRANTARADVAEVGIKEMKLSDGRIDYFVSIQVGGREITPYKFSERWKAELEVAAFRHVFFNEPEVDYAAFGHAPSQGDST